MSDLIRRSDVAAIIDDHLSRFSIDENNPVQSAYAMAHNHIKEILKFIPAVDAVEVVRCRECIHSGRFYNTGSYIDCVYSQRLHESDFYCKDGQRREDGDGDGDQNNM